MQQFGPQFINNHLMPLLEEMLEDTVQREKDYLDKLFINGVLEESEKKNLMDFYFNASRKSVGVPFVGPEEKKDRENLLKHFVEYIRSRGAKPEDRIRAFLPVIDEKSEGAIKKVVWPADVKRNLFLMSYHIAENFEKDHLDELITARAATGKTDDVEQAKKDRELLEKGMLILVKDPATGEYTKYIRATDLKPGDTAVQFLPPPSPEMAKVMEGGFVVPSAENLAAIAKSGVAPQALEVIAQGGVSPQVAATPSSYEQKDAGTVPDHVSTNDELTKSFQQKRGKAIVNHLKKLGFTPLGDVQFDANGHAMIKVKSGNDNLLVSVDTRVPFDQDLKFTMTFQTGPAAGKSMTIDENKLDAAFTKAAGGFRSARELYDDVDLSKKLGIKSDAYPEKAPLPQPKPVVGLPTGPGPGGVPGQLPGLPPAKLPGMPGTMPIPTEGGPGGGGPGGLPFTMPSDYKAKQPPPQPQLGTGTEGVTGGYKVKAVPGIPPGSPMDAKAKLKQKEQEEEGQPAYAFGAPPIAPGRVGGFGAAPGAPTGGGGAKPKSHFVRNMILAQVGGVSTAVGGGLLLGAANSAPQSDVAVNVVKSIWIALRSFLPHLLS